MDPEKRERRVTFLGVNSSHEASSYLESSESSEIGYDYFNRQHPKVMALAVTPDIQLTESSFDGMNGELPHSGGQYDPLNRDRTNSNIEMLEEFDLKHLSKELLNASLSQASITEEEIKQLKKSFNKNVMSINVAFFLLFSSFVGLAIVQSTLNGREGVIGLSIIFLVTILSCVLLSPITNHFLGSKLCLILSFIGFAAWEAANYYPVWGLIIPCAVLCGLANGIVWTTQSTLFTNLSIQLAETVGDRVDVIIAKSFGTFFCFLLFGTSFGCFITSLVLTVDLTNEPSSNTTTPTPTPDPGGPRPECGANFCPSDDEEGKYLYPRSVHDVLVNFGSVYDNYPKIRSLLPTPKPEQIYFMIGIHTVCTVIGLLLIIFLVDTAQKQKSHGTEKLAAQAWTSIKNTFRQMKRFRQIMMTPLNIYTGISKSFILAEVTQAYVGCALGVVMIGYSLLAYGILACIVSFSCGQLISKTGRIPIFTTAYLVALGMCIFLMLWVPDTRQLVVFFAIPGTWAVADGIFISQVNAYYGYMFRDNTQAAFSAFRFWEGIGLVVGYVLNSFVCVRNKLYLMVAILSLGILGYYVVEYVQRGVSANSSNPRGRTNNVTRDTDFSTNAPIYTIDSGNAHYTQAVKEPYSRAGTYETSI